MPAARRQPQSTTQKKARHQRNPLAQPFLKWAGGKRQLLPKIKQMLPVDLAKLSYYEPFIGAGAVLFSLQPKKGTINDTNLELINCYEVIRDNPEELIEICNFHKEKNSKEYFYKLRSLDRDNSYTELSKVEKAARIIYLNKTCFNGLFRVNSNGQFNVPYGNYKNPIIADKSIILSISKYLNDSDIKIQSGDFEDALKYTRKNSFIYFDPPYQPLSDTSSFTGYSINGFGEEEQERLKSLCDKLNDRGCKILLSNSNAPLIRELYSDNRYEIIEVKASRAINSVASKRGKINELLIFNKYERQKN